MIKSKRNKGFTLLEILLVIAAIGILAAIVLVAINPNKQIESARSAQRRSEINSITKAIQQYSIDNNGQYPTGIDIGAKVICNTGSQKSTDTLNPANLCNNKTDLRVLVPTYIASIPQSDSNNYYVRRSNNNIEVSHPRDTIWNIGGTPSLDLNFAKNKSLIDGVSGNNLISFTRASTGTYVGEDGLIKTAVANEARFDHNPTTGESLGLLVEESRTNNYFESENIAGTSAFSASTSSLNVATAPDGSQAADKLIGNNGQTGRQSVSKAPTLNAGTTYTFSVYLKAAERTFATIWFDSLNITEGAFWGANGWLDLSTGVSSNTTQTKIVPVGNGWYRAFVTATPTVTGPFNLQVGIGTPNNLSDTGAPAQMKYTGDGSSGIFVWGGQLELGSFPTSYLINPNTTGVTTRNADNVSITGANFTTTPGGWYNQSEGTALQLYSHTGAAGSNNGLFNFHNSISPNNDRFTIRAGTYSVTTGGVTQATSNYSIPSANNLAKIAFAYKTDDTALMRPVEQSILSDTSVILPTGINTLEIGKIEGTALQINGHIRRLTYWPTRLSNTVLQSITQ